ncbi:hypothetical protein ACHAXT_004796 [Thalassiosira profunda]
MLSQRGLGQVAAHRNWFQSSLLLLLGAYFIIRELTDGVLLSNSSTPAVSRTSSHVGGLCDDLLDGFDRRFDEMRAARQNETATINLDHIGQGSWFDIFEPEAACFTDERFGSKTRTGRYGAVGDGPKFLCGVDHLANKAARLAEKGADERCLVYSIGSNNDVSFERAVHDFMPGCEVHTFDPTLRKAFVGDEYATFHDWGLGKDGESAAHRGKSWTAKGLETIMQELGHTNRTIDILKVDCEGCEYETLPPVFDAMVAGNVQIGQLQVEMHIGGRGVRDIHDFFAAADRATLRIFHKERNHWGCAGYNTHGGNV